MSAGSPPEVAYSTASQPLPIGDGLAAWHAPESWNCSNPPASVMIGPESEPSASAPSYYKQSSIAHSQDEQSVSLSLNLSGMQREILQMAAASHETFLRRLTEEWGSSSDAALYKELEMEKKRWMLSALHSINPSTDRGVAQVPIADRRILAFFESHGEFVDCNSSGCRQSLF